MIKLEHFRVFLTVAKTKSLVDAASKLGRTPSAVSMTLKQIEDILGGSLFEGERKSTLTPLGKYVADRANSAVREHEKTLKDVMRFSRGEEGVVRIAAVPTAAARILPIVTEKVYNSHPNLQMEIRDGDSEAVAIAVTQNAVDFGIASLSAASDGLNETLLAEDPFVLVCRSDHPLVELDHPITLSDISEHKFIANGLCRKIQTKEMDELLANAKLFLHNVTTLYTFVERGFGVTLMPKLSVQENGNLIALPLDSIVANRRLYLMKRDQETLSPAAEIFIENLMVVHTYEGTVRLNSLELDNV